MIDTRNIVGYGADADPSRRPGIPREQRPPRPLPTAIEPVPMSTDVVVFKHGRPNKTMPPVYGTAQPPHGLSGRVRAAAYSYPDHMTRHWMMLLLADRIDVMEHRLSGARGATMFAAVLLGAGVVVAAATLARRRRGASRRPIERVPAGA